MNLSMDTITIFDFNTDTNINTWYIVNDVVMGGRSNSRITLSTEGHGVFEGYVSLDNNGGFASVRHRLDPIYTSDKTRIVLRVKGDGKKYQFRIKDRANQYYSYVQEFQTSGSWEEVELELSDFYPAFRGRTLNIPNFDSSSIEEIALLIGNKTEESFKIMIDEIEIR